MAHRPAQLMDLIRSDRLARGEAADGDTASDSEARAFLDQFKRERERAQHGR